MDGHYTNLTAFNAAIAAEQYNLFDILLDGAVKKANLSASPAIQFITNKDASISVLPNYSTNITGLAAGAITAHVGNTGNGTFAKTTLDPSIMKAETLTIKMLTATTFTVVGSVHGYYGSGALGTEFSVGCPVHFLGTAGGTPFAAGDYFTCVIS